MDLVKRDPTRFAGSHDVVYAALEKLRDDVDPTSPATKADIQRIQAEIDVLREMVQRLLTQAPVQAPAGPAALEKRKARREEKMFDELEENERKRAHKRNG